MQIMQNKCRSHKFVLHKLYMQIPLGIWVFYSRTKINTKIRLIYCIIVTNMCLVKFILVAVPGGESDISFEDKHLLTVLCGGDQLRKQGGTRASNRIQIQVNDWMGSCQYLKIGMVK